MKFTTILISILILFSSGIYSQSFDQVWETERVFKTPESVYYDAARNQIYVSNINGKPTDKDGNGFISILDTTGKVKQLKWVSGMDAPKGMLVLRNFLFVTDIDRYHIIDIDRAEIVRTNNVEGAVFLNDLAADSDGNLFISDMSNHQILYAKDGKTSIWLEGDEIISPNGLAFHKEFLFVGVKNNLLKINPVDKKIKIHIEETGPIDGLVPIGVNKFVISDWSGRILMVNPTEKFVLSNTTEKQIQAADLGYISDKKLILIPTFFDNRVVACALP